MFAASNGHADIVKYLIAQGANVNNKDEEGKFFILKSWLFLY